MKAYVWLSKENIDKYKKIEMDLDLDSA